MSLNIDKEELEKYASLLDKINPHKLCELEGDINCIQKE